LAGEGIEENGERTDQVLVEYQGMPYKRSVYLNSGRPPIAGDDFLLTWWLLGSFIVAVANVVVSLSPVVGIRGEALPSPPPPPPRSW
jgi:hypothetical protein